MTKKAEPRYQVLSSGYVTSSVVGSPGDIGAGYRPHKLVSEHGTRAEAEAAAYDAAQPSAAIHGTNSTWRRIEQVYVRDRRANR